MPPRAKTRPALPSAREGDETDIPEWARPQNDGQDQAAAIEDQAPAGESHDGQSGEPQETETVSGTIARSATPALDHLLAWLAAVAVDGEGDSLAGLEAIVAQVLTAEDPASVLRQQLASTAEQWLDKPLLLKGFTIRESEYDSEKSLPYYASMDVMAGNPPEARVVNCGSVKVLAQLKRLYELDEWPVLIKITEARKAKKGENAPLTLVALES